MCINNVINISQWSENTAQNIKYAQTQTELDHIWFNVVVEEVRKYTKFRGI